MTTPPPRVLVLERTSELAARIRHNALSDGATVKACPDVARVESHLAGGRWDVLVAGPSFMHRTGLRRLSTVHQRFPWVSVVLALNERPRADLAEIVQVGADDLVPLHADDAEFGQALTRATRLSRGRLGAASGAARRGRIIMVSSASGGCGKTFVATNTADFLARTTGQPVVLLDLDLQFGEVSTALRLRPETTITDALAAEAEGHDLDEHLDEYLLRHPDGFSVLAAPRLPAEADSVTPGDIVRLLDVLRARGAWVVIDTHEGLSDLVVAALEATDHVFTLATPDRPSLLNLGTLLRAMRGLGVSAESISVILNKAEADVGLDAVDMAAQLGRRFDAVIPYAREVARSLNSGVPLLAGEPKSPISAALAAAFSTVLPARDRPAVAPAEPRTPRRRLARRTKPAAPVAALAPTAAPPATTVSPPAPPVPPVPREPEAAPVGAPVDPSPLIPVPLSAPADGPDGEIDLSEPGLPPSTEPDAGPVAAALPAAPARPARSGPFRPSTPRAVQSTWRERAPPPPRSDQPTGTARTWRGRGRHPPRVRSPPAAAPPPDIRPKRTH